MQNLQDAPLDETQTDSQLSAGGAERVDVVDLCDTSSPALQDDTPSSAPLLCESQRNEIFAAAIEFLTNLSTEEAKNHTVHHFIEEAVDYITAFMDELLSTPSISPDYMGCVTSLLNTSFVIQLFQLRAVFRGLAAQARPRTGTNITIISWVDDLLVKLCACILHLATNGAMRDFNKRVGTRSIKSLQDNEARKAATQLPVKFTELPDALISKYSSPAMARMALTLLYGTTVLQQRYKAIAKQEAAQQNIEGLISVVSKCIIKYGVGSGSPSPASPLTLTEFAILVSLYAHGTCLDTDHTFAPHIEHNVVGLVDLILDNFPGSSHLSTHSGSGSSSVLVEDLSVVEWFWNRWGDGSTLLAATGLRLTRHWVRHYKSGVANRNQVCIEALASRSPCSFQALLHLVEPLAAGTLIPAPPSLDDIKIVELVCEAYTALATARQPGDLRYEQILAEACKRLCPYILISSPDGAAGPIRKPLLGFLVSIGPAAIRMAYGGASEPQPAHICRGVPEQAIQEIMTIIERSEEGPEDQTAPKKAFHPAKLKYLLDFLAILLHSNTRASQVVLSSAFLPRLISWMSRPLDKWPVLEQAEWSMLRTSTLLLLGFAYSHFKTCRSPSLDRFPEHEQDTFLEVVLDNEGDWLLETCALARYMVATEDARILDDPVVMLEVWSQIRDVLLATLQRRFAAEQEPISVAVSGTLCASLVSIIRSVGEQTRAIILASPWTQTLRVELERVGVRGNRLDDFALGLGRQLEGIANTFVRETAGNIVEDPLEDSVHLVCVDLAGWLQIVPMFVAPGPVQ